MSDGLVLEKKIMIEEKGYGKRKIHTELAKRHHVRTNGMNKDV